MQIKNYLRFAIVVLSSLTLFFVLTGSAGFSQGSNINLCDYTPPVTTYQSLAMDVNYHFYDDPFLSTEGDINRGSALGNYDFIYSHPDYSLNFSTNANLSMTASELTYDATGSARYNAYLTETNLFGFGGFQTNISSSFSETVGLRVITGSGFGRFRNVTPLVKAVLIEDMLDRSFVTLDGLPEELIKEIAQRIDTIGPEKSLDDVVSEITELIETNEEIDVDTLGSIEVLRIREIIQEGTDQRLCGWEARAGIGYEAIDPEGEARDLLVDAAVRFARPFTTSSQLTLGMDFTSPFELTESYTVTGLASYIYQFNRNVDTKFQYSLLYQQGTELFYQHSYSATADVQIRRDLATSVNLSLTDNSDYEEMTKEITIGVSFDLL